MFPENRVWCLSVMKQTIFLLFAAILCACGPGESTVEEPPAPAVLFPATEACTYPSLAAGKTYSKLGGGTWAALDAQDANSLFECSGSIRSVKILDDGKSLIQVDYAVTGTKDGASMISLDYTASGPSPIPNESTHRNVFMNMVDTVVKEGLKNPLPDLFRRKMSNLKSYAQPGKGSAENFDIGTGFVSLSREASPGWQSVNMAVKIYPDAAFKLQ
jgi:hypothetical protein